MAKKLIIVGLVCFILSCVCYSSELSIRQQVIELASSQVGNKETSTNSGPEVDNYIKSCGLKPPAEWCACFTNWVYDSCGIATPSYPALAANWFPKNKLITELDGVYTASTVGWYFTSRKGIHHIAFIREIDGDDIVVISGNLDNQVKVKRYPVTQNMRFSDWIKTKPDYHIVKPQDTVYKISLTYKVSVDTIMKRNNLKNYRIQVGQKIWLN